MGAPETEKGSDSDERPRRRVAFANQFAVGRFAVTFEEWDACVAQGGCKKYRPSDRSWGRGRQPVINVWWEDARAYVRWIAEKTLRPYRLLSEAEREYVTRAGTAPPFWWGGSISSEQANYGGDFKYGCGGRGVYRQRTARVDSFVPNPWGLYQVHGNVYEWVQDCWNRNYEGAPSDGSAWLTGDCARRVMRGGSWRLRRGTYDQPPEVPSPPRPIFASWVCVSPGHCNSPVWSLSRRRERLLPVLNAERWPARRNAR